VWTVVEDGKTIKNGTVEDLNVEPQQRANLDLGYRIAPQGETMLNVEFQLKEAEPLMRAGQTVAYRQMPFRQNGNVKSSGLAEGKESGKLKIRNKKDEPSIKITGKGFEMAFNKQTGLLERYVAGGTQMLGEGGTLKPTFWRAVTDNDMGAGLQKKCSAWRDPQMNLTQITAEKKESGARVSAIYDMPQVKATLTLTYDIDPEGVITVGESLKTTAGADVAAPLRFGMVMQLPYAMDKSVYYGRGPIENYPDRKDFANVGIYEQTADQQFFPYIRPQETGTKCDIRWWKQTDASGKGVRIEPGQDGKYLMASALHYSISELDDGDEKDQRHAVELKKSPFTELIIGSTINGLGGINTWGALPLKPYRMKYGDMQFTFRIQPF
ncbi:MAG: beta-galactosidase small subunit family protein, partial [Prevotella sp.]